MLPLVASLISCLTADMWESKGGLRGLLTEACFTGAIEEVLRVFFFI